MTSKKEETMKALEEKSNLPEATKKPMNKFGKQETFEVEGVTYTMQFPGVRAAQKILDESKGFGGRFSDEAYNERLMNDVIVEPKVDWDYWDQNSGYREVMQKADNFLGRMLN